MARKERAFIKTLFDMVRFVVEKDYPQQFPAFTQFSLAMLGQLDLSDISVLLVKQLREVFYFKFYRLFLRLENVREQLVRNFSMKT